MRIGPAKCGFNWFSKNFECTTHADASPENTSNIGNEATDDESHPPRTPPA